MTTIDQPTRDVERVLACGASARAACQSIARAGYNPVAIDLFADRDLLALCPNATQVTQYPSGISRAAANYEFDYWMITGALENHASLIHLMSETFGGYVGCSAKAIQATRSPRLVRQLLLDHNLPTPRIVFPGERRDSSTRWIRKPERSAGGRGIRLVSSNEEAQDGFFLQEFIEGDPCSATFVGCGNRAYLIGITKQLIGREWCGARGFEYCGSIGPIPIDDESAKRWHQLGNAIASSFDLTGLFGVDAIVKGEEIWLIEINPRYTASGEVLERAYSKLSLVRQHVDACRKVSVGRFQLREPEHFSGKAVLFAPQELHISDSLSNTLLSMSAEESSVADIPQPGRISPRNPVLTVFADSMSLVQTENLLQEAAKRVYRLLQGN